MMTTKPTEPDCYKVVIVGGEPRFAKIHFGSCSHADMVKEGETATAAGFISIRGDGSWKITDSYSMTLKLRIGSEEDIALLKTVLGNKYKEPYE